MSQAGSRYRMPVSASRPPMGRWGCLLLPALLCFAMALPASEPLPIEAYTRPAKVEPGSFRLSPTGQYVSAVVPLDDRSVLLVYERVTNKPTAKIALDKGQFVNDYWWVSDNRVVLSIMRKLGGADTPEVTGELWAIDADGKNGKLLFEENAEFVAAYVLDPEVDASNHFLVALQPLAYGGELPYIELAQMHAMTGRYKKNGGRIPIRYFSKVLSDASRRARIVYGYTADGEGRLYHRQKDGLDWVLLNDQAKSGRDFFPLSYAADGNSIYAQVSESKRPNYLVRLDLQSRRETLIYGPQTADIGPLLRTADGNDAYAVIDYDSDPRGGLAIFNKAAPEAALSKELSALFPGQLAVISSFSRDGRYASVFVASDLNPGQFYIYDRDIKTLHKAASIRPDISPEQAFPVEPVEFKARDGLVVRGWLTRPPAPPGGSPLVVMPHGGPYGIVDRWGFHPDAQLLASRGYAVLQVNFRGSGGYGLDFIDAGYREWGGKMQTDLTDAARAVLATKSLNPDKVCLFGISYGAYASLMGVASEPGLFKCAVGYSGLYDLGLERKLSGNDGQARVRNFFNDIFKDDKQWLESRSPAKFAGQIKAPVLLIHGGQDDNTPPKQAEIMRKALIAAGNPPQWVFEETEGHGFFDPRKRLNAYTKIIEFLDANIGPQAK